MRGLRLERMRSPKERLESCCFTSATCPQGKETKEAAGATSALAASR